MDRQNYQLAKLARRKTGYPIATVAYYGPDHQFASKVVVGIQVSEHNTEVTGLKRWFAGDLDVREDLSILSEMIAYLDTHHVIRIVMVDRIIGCPHEEGVDYPVGEKCPRCPYWANRDRWDGE